MRLRHLLGVTAIVCLTSACVGAQALPAGSRRVETVERGRKRAVVYDAKGGVIQTEEQIDERDLPKPVADAMHSHRRAIFVSALKVTRKGQEEYHLTVRGSRKTAMVAKADGTVLSFQ